MFESYQKYVTYLSFLRERFVSIESMQFNVYLTSGTDGYASGVITFRDDITLTFIEQIDFDNKQLFDYGYTAYQSDNKLFYYDPQEHPNDPQIATTYPHHKHIPPNINRNRIAAPGITFEKSNLEFIIKEIEETLL